jgi:hypothetical protein
MSNISELISNDVGGMPYVRFERMAVEDPQASLKAGSYVARDIDYVKITPPYSKDIFTTKVTSWKEQLKVDAANGRIPNDWLAKYNAAYEAWLTGQELPLDGTPIKGWGVCSPAQQETLIRMHVLTVEQLADMNHEGLVRVGMGGNDLKNKATAWLKQLKKAGPATLEIAALKKENDVLNHSVETMRNQIEELTGLVKSLDAHTQPQALSHTGIGIDDLMGDD